MGPSTGCAGLADARVQVGLGSPHFPAVGGRVHPGWPGRQGQPRYVGGLVGFILALLAAMAFVAAAPVEWAVIPVEVVIPGPGPGPGPIAPEVEPALGVQRHPGVYVPVWSTVEIRRPEEKVQTAIANLSRCACEGMTQ